jgi:hypothetical protein
MQTFPKALLIPPKLTERAVSSGCEMVLDTRGLFESPAKVDTHRANSSVTDL